MAVASGNTPELELQYEQNIFNSEDVDSEEEDTKNNEQPGSSKQHNGSVMYTADRYGFTGGDQYTDPAQKYRIPLSVLRKRELKWLDMLENWEKWMSKRFKKVKERCRKGIPESLRARAWQYLCGSKFLMEKKENKGKFENYLLQDGNPKYIDDIEKDLHRQFPFHEMFVARGGHGQEDLFRVLKAYSIHNPRDGYCQAQAPIAAVLLMHMPAEHAFWAMVAICDKYLPGYYSPGLEAVQVDGDVLFGLLKKVCHSTYKHLKKQKCDPIMYMTEWFMCVFTRTLTWPAVLRVWDMFLCEGVKVMFRVALVLFKSVLGRSDQLAECPTVMETVEKLRKIPSEFMEEEYLVTECLKLPITERDMEKEHQYQVAKRRAMKNADAGSSKKKKKQRKESSDHSR